MNKNYPLAELKQKLEEAQKILIVLPQKPIFDQVSAALSLSLALTEDQKNAPVVCNSAMTVEFNHLVGVNKITDRVRGTDLIISLNYPSEQIEKVSYNDDDNRPNVVIQPKAGAASLTENLVQFSYAGLGADLIIGVGLKDISFLNLNDLELNQSFFVNIDNDPENSQFGSLNIIDQEASSLSEMITSLIVGLNLPLSLDTAQNLLTGIWKQTRNLSGNLVNADTYEAVSLCLRAGAKKPIIEESIRPQSQPNQLPRREEFVAQRPRFVQRQPNKPVLPVSPEEKKEEFPQKPPADWFEPKIFKSGNLS